ncbi:hypothetical protein JWG39_09810 [Desulforhopalus vacuolatus]|uniref:hypothetical protein n=1 Tax=Desulforhopalus vacuolatus TaxID=40414 RepID=UPI0019652AF6|nr:hypothetical protein [Desulforhopalus vacuolatus]MBM9520109.1 hypothetical protein [Desulforhopalus vacuolatus]
MKIAPELFVLIEGMRGKMNTRYLLLNCFGVFVIVILLLLTSSSTKAARFGESPEDDIFNVWGRDSMHQAAREVEEKNKIFRKSAQESAEKIINGMKKEIKKVSKSSDICLKLKTSVPGSLPLVDEIKYISERTIESLFIDDYEVNRSMSYLLFHSEQPSVTGLQNPYVKYTKGPSQVSGLPISRELRLARMVAQSKGDLMPEDIVRMALKATNGDYPAAMLTAHNFLKETAYSMRGAFRPSPAYMVIPAPSSKKEEAQLINKLQRKLGRRFYVSANDSIDGDIQITVVDKHKGSLGRKLRNFRLSDDKNKSDKMGPWYHMFGVLYVSSISKGGRFTGESWAKVEGLARNLPFFSSPPDYFKTLLTDITGEQSGALLDAVSQASKLEKCQKLPKMMKKINRLNHPKFLDTLKTLNIKTPNAYLNCLCRNAGYGSSGTRQFYHPDTLGKFDERYSCQHPGEPCVVAGYGCLRHPLPTKTSVINSCLQSNPIGMKKDKEGKDDPKSGTRLDDLIIKKLQKR